MELITLCKVTKRNQTFTNIDDTVSSKEHSVHPGKLLHKDKRRVRQYISNEIKDTTLVKNPQRNSNYYSYNMCHETNNNTRNSTEQTICASWTSNGNKKNPTPRHPGRLQSWDRSMSMFSKKAYDARIAQEKQKPLINNNNNQPMQHLFKFWNQMKTPKSKSFSDN